LNRTIETFDLTKKLSDLVAVDILDISVEQGEVFALLGPNGVRKTTARCINFFMPFIHSEPT
jgi:ABC-type multidrug transport system ATPase subunit